MKLSKAEIVTSQAPALGWRDFSIVQRYNFFIRGFFVFSKAASCLFFVGVNSIHFGCRATCDKRGTDLLSINLAYQMVALNSPPIFVALDRPDPEDARRLVRLLSPMGCGFKIGLTLLPLLSRIDIAEFRALGGEIFLDYKLHDIRQTVFGAVQSICTGPAGFLTVHAEIPVMEAAVAAKQDHTVKLLAVTVLSSLDDGDLFAAGYKYGVRAMALQRAKAARDIGMDGLICSPHEVEMLREVVGSEMLLITPGVRPKGAALDDQKRVMSPVEAIRAGADYLVIGRPIVAADDPEKALADIIDSLS